MYWSCKEMELIQRLDWSDKGTNFDQYVVQCCWVRYEQLFILHIILVNENGTYLVRTYTKKSCYSYDAAVCFMDMTVEVPSLSVKHLREIACGSSTSALLTLEWKQITTFPP